MSRQHVALALAATALVVAGAAWLRREPDPRVQAPETARNETSRPGDDEGPATVRRSTHTVPTPELGPDAKPVTLEQKVLVESHIPAVAALSIDRQGSPREWLSSAGTTAQATREAQLTALSRRSRGFVERLRARRDATSDDQERARLTADLAVLERNLAERHAVTPPTVRDERRPFSERSR